MYQPKFELSGFSTLPTQRKQIVLRAFLEALVVADWNYLLEHPDLPSIYQCLSPDAYILKQRPMGLDSWQDIPRTLELGTADCKDLACLAKYSKILIKDRGSIPISEVAVGDFAATRSGWKKVAGAMLTRRDAELRRCVFVTGGELVATPDHRIWTATRDWIEMKDVVRGDVLLGHDCGDGSKSNKLMTIAHVEDAPSCNVYDLAVEDAHEFFADGVLVHNCWRIAELRNAGYDDVYPHIKVSYHNDPSGREPPMTVYHIQVRIHETIEDPSAILGMPTQVSYDQLRG
jgi:hypothetical protein